MLINAWSIFGRTHNKLVTVVASEEDRALEDRGHLMLTLHLFLLLGGCCWFFFSSMYILTYSDR